MPNLLIVEDEDAQREILQVAFEDNYTVRTASDGLEALEIIANWQPDLVITDYSMPGIKGLELIRKIKENGHMREKSAVSGQCKIILLSAYLTQEIREQAKSMGVICMEKPFDLKMLRSIVRQETQIKI